MQRVAVMRLCEVNSCFGPVEKAAALVFLLYLAGMKPSCEQVDHTVAHSSLAEMNNSLSHSESERSLGLHIWILAHTGWMTQWLNWLKNSG